MVDMERVEQIREDVQRMEVDQEHTHDHRKSNAR